MMSCLWRSYWKEFTMLRELRIYVDDVYDNNVNTSY